MKRVAEEWKSRRPELELELIPATNAAVIKDKFITQAASGDPIDASFMNVFRARDLHDQGQLLELDRYVRQAPEVADNKFLKASEPPRKTRGKTFGIPAMGPESWCLMANGNTFRAEGLNPQGRDLKTWDDLARVAQQLTRREGDEVKRSGFLMPQLDLYNFTGWVNTSGTSLFDAEQTKANYTASTTVATLEYLHRLYDRLRVTAPLGIPNRPVVPGAILGGDAAIVHELTSALTTRYTTTPPDFEYWLVPYPRGRAERCRIQRHGRTPSCSPRVRAIPSAHSSSRAGSAAMWN